jgi:glycogen phosphorylase
MSKIWDDLNALARNPWWSWDGQATHLFRQLAPEVWEASRQSPSAVLDTLGEDGVLRRLDELDLRSRAEESRGRLTAYLEDPDPVGRRDLGIHPGSNLAAYFCAEFGIHESIPIYAGGLGVLAGDHLKSASDLGVPMVAVGLLYREGYFTQLLDREGRQHAYYRRNDMDRMGLRLVHSDGDQRFTQLQLPVGGDPMALCMWRAEVGRVPLILLDAGLWQNRPSDRDTTMRLYGGRGDIRIRQEILLGIGGVRALRYLGYAPDVWHLNEGHTAFLTLELVREQVEAGASFHEAVEEVRRHCIFTTHTPVPAGHDRFPADMVERNLGWMREALGVDQRTFLGLGRVNPDDPHETFCMTVLGLRLSRSANGVSELHGHVSRRMWHALWPGRALEEVPIGHITNGVHVPTWMALEMAELLDSQLGRGWRDRCWDEALWQRVREIPDSLLWAVHNLLKRRLVEFARQRVRHDLSLTPQKPFGLSSERILDPEWLTIGFARRFATYKRGDLLFRDMDRARRVLANPERPIQLLFAGKAHPQDFGGSEIIRNVIRASQDPVLRSHVVFLPDYGMNVAKYLVHGVDVWLNNPRRPREASGTSGMKGPLNGAINLSTVDGWWPEAYNGTNGWNIGDDRHSDSEWEQDHRDQDALYWLLENQIAPLYYRRDTDGLPRKWLQFMKRSIETITPAFNSDRMVREYARLYWPAQR